MKDKCTLKTHFQEGDEVASLVEGFELRILNGAEGGATIDQEVEIKVKADAKSSNMDKIHSVTMFYIGGRGRPFGEKMIVKFKLVEAVPEIEIYQHAMNMMEQETEKKFTFEEWVHALKLYSNDEQKATEFLILSLTKVEEKPQPAAEVVAVCEDEV